MCRLMERIRAIRHDAGDPDDGDGFGVTDAREARRRSEAILDAVRARGPEVTSISAAMSGQVERNHFQEMLTAAMARRRRGNRE